jgi:hypothetical protein
MALDQQPAGTPVQFPAVSPPIFGHTYIGVRAGTKTLKGVVPGTYRAGSNDDGAFLTP